jgi:hypothetical protein
MVASLVGLEDLGCESRGAPGERLESLVEVDDDPGCPDALEVKPWRKRGAPGWGGQKDDHESPGRGGPTEGSPFELHKRREGNISSSDRVCSW